MAENKDPFVKFGELLGVDLKKLAKAGNPTADILKEVVAEREAKKREKQKEKATEWIGKAVEIQEQAEKVDAEYSKAKKKLTEELGNVLNQISQAMGSQPVKPEQPTEAPVAADTPAGT